ncbi:MAG: glycosyltransferase family 39 protein [Marinilabiliaceae bacterium]|nr:glycosyltransferase family 39 protein [Marinilabiliaceae bacterium]
MNQPNRLNLLNRIIQKKEYLVIFILVLVKVAIHIITNINAGFDGDEIMHIDAGNHLAWGYMSIQPLIGLLAWVQNLCNSDSVFVHHLFAHCAAVGIMIISGLTVIKLGGSWKAVLLVLTCILVAPGFSYSQHIFTPLVFEQLFWLLSFYLLIIYNKENKAKYLIYLAICLALGLMVKLSILIFIAGIGISILLCKRDVLVQKSFWLAAGIFLVIISPNLFWQYQHGFPAVQHMTALHGKMLVKFDVLDNLKLLFITTNPFAAVVWLTAILFAPFVAFAKNIRVVAIAMCIPFLILVVFRGQFHYYFPTILTALCVGSVVLENYLKSRIKWLWLYLPLLVVSAFILTPKMMPVLPLDKYIENLNHSEDDKNEQLFFTQQSIADNRIKNKDERIPISFEAYYTHNDWLNLTEALNTIYQRLPQDKQSDCLIWTRCYTQAGGINLYGKKYKLPQAFTQHAGCYEWIPTFDKNVTIIVVANAKSPADSLGIGSFFAPAFDKLTWKQAVFCPYARTSSNAYYMLYLGEGLRFNSDTLKLRYEDYIFE